MFYSLPLLRPSLFSSITIWIFLPTSSLGSSSSLGPDILFSNSAVKAHDSQAYGHMALTKKRTSFTFDIRYMLFAYLWDRVCSIFSGAGKFCFTHGLR